MATTEDFKIKITAEGLEKLDKIAKSAENASGKINMLAASILGVGFGAFLKGAIEMSDRLSDLSDATGISIATIKGFEGALGAAGGKSRNTERAILGFVTAIETANDGSLKVRDAFNAVGVSLTDLRNLSESDLLLKTIEGLKGMEEGSARTSIQATLLTKAFRGVDAKKFFAEFEAGKITSEQLAEKMRKLGDANDRMEKTFRTFQEGAVIALEPIIGLFGDAGVTAEAAGKMITFVGVALGLAFGASMVAKILAVNEAILGTALVSNLVGKNPLIKLLAGVAITAVGAGAAWGTYELALSKAEEQQKKLNETLKEGNKGANPNKPGGPAERTQQLDPRQKAVIESEKRTQQSLDEARKSAEMSTTDDVKNIRLTAIAEIAKARAEIESREYLSAAQKETELAAKRVEINGKADNDIAKIRSENAKKIDETVGSLAQANDERQRGLNLEIQGMGQSTAATATQRKLLDLEKERVKAIIEISKQSNVTPEQVMTGIERINAEFERGAELIRDNENLQRSFSKGWADAFNSYVDNATNAANTARDSFQAMTGAMNGAIDIFVESGKFSFSDFTNSILKDLVKIQLKASVAGLFGSINSAAGAGGVMGALGNLFKAGGGPVSANSPYIVGEKGPELFMPNTSGSIIPNNQLSSSGVAGSTNINYNISAVDALSFKQMIARDPSFLYAVTLQGQKAIPNTRG